MILPAEPQAKLPGRDGGGVDEDPRISRKGKRNARELVHAHLRSNGYSRDLDDIDGPLADDVAAQDRVGLAVGNQLAEAGLEAIVVASNCTLAVTTSCA
jgi:hypothetical protein